MRPFAGWLATVLAAGTGIAHGGSAAFDYTLHCQGCHLESGAGTPGSVPALAGSVGRFVRVPGGRDYLVRVPGVAQAPLADGELAEVLNWVLRRFGPPDLPADFVPFTAAEVGRNRHRPLTDVESTRRVLLEAFDRDHGAATAP